MSEVLNNFTTEDNYVPKNTLTFGACQRVNIDATNAAVYYQLQAAEGDGSVASNDGRWLPEIYMGPSFRSLSRSHTGVRVRSAVAGKPAQVTIESVPLSQLGDDNVVLND